MPFHRIPSPGLPPDVAELKRKDRIETLRYIEAKLTAVLSADPRIDPTVVRDVQRIIQDEIDALGADPRIEIATRAVIRHRFPHPKDADYIENVDTGDAAARCREIAQAVLDALDTHAKMVCSTHRDEI